MGGHGAGDWEVERPRGRLCRWPEPRVAIPRAWGWRAFVSWRDAAVLPRMERRISPRAQSETQPSFGCNREVNTSLNPPAPGRCVLE